MKRTYFVFAGESSGDLHGSLLIKSLKSLNKDLDFIGVGGPLMRAQGLTSTVNMEEFQVMGFTDVIKALPKLIKNFFFILKTILKTNPDGVILIDYPGFNLRLAKKLRKKGYKGKIIQYICPSVWAHGKGRIQTLIENHDLLLTIFPFELAYFQNSPLKVKYIGNPLTENLINHQHKEDWKETIGIPNDKKIISIFPGSRWGEIEHNLPILLEACQQLKEKHSDLIFGLSCSQNMFLERIKEMMTQTALKMNEDLYIVPKDKSYELMKESRIALAKSGTVNLELALRSIPTVVTYSLSKLNYWIAKYILKLNLPHYSIVNILAKKEVFPELIGTNIQSKDIFYRLDQLNSNEDLRQSIVFDCTKIKNELGSAAPNQVAAIEIESLFRSIL